MKDSELDGITDLDVIKQKLGVLYKEQEIVNNKILRLVRVRDKIIGNVDEKYIKSIPKDIKNINKKQWEWILEKNNETDRSACRFVIKNSR